MRETLRGSYDSLQAIATSCVRDVAAPSHAQVEELKLLSTAEKLGLLSLAERALTSDPGAISSLSILPFLGAVGALPQETMKTAA